ncbi:hypothetical protein [Paenibacillus sp. LHD-38]|uniref:hypothetical protein n=1 Tax=Paenibacillus sp. LHD-38 TaxID=3072143 RepID=UPI00280E7411|nr:hypothetical protein [Paenibacillus sp. LHD-38]MDQ8734820.1 hypothetical protein [Paenibacillus sp. LHD-38]
MTNPLSLNLYTYVENNPLIYTDSSGYLKYSEKEDSERWKQSEVYVSFGFWDNVDKDARSIKKKTARLMFWEELADEVGAMIQEGVAKELFSDKIWKNLTPFARGEFLESLLAKTTYDAEDWFNIGSTMGGYYPIIDFVSHYGGYVVSVKTIDPRLYSSSGLSLQLSRFVESLTERDIFINNKLVTFNHRILHLIVPKGTKDDIDLKKFQDEAGDLIIRVEEF